VIGKTALEIGLWANPLQSPEVDPGIGTPLSPHHYETEFRTKSGEIGTAWLFREFVELGNGKHFVDTLLDISERKRIEEELHASREAEKEFSEHLTALSEITTELSKEEKLEALCRRVIEMGQERLGYDRLSLWFVTEDRNSIKGMFGVDVQGRITDERQSTIQLNSASLIWPVLRGQIPIQLNANARLFAGGQVVGQGMRVTAGLWDGETVIGFLSVDNLLQKRPFTDHDCEILHLYASAVGHLCSLKKAQEALTRLKEELERHVTERTAQLEFANKELDAFNYSISHDLRTPLRSLDGFSRLLQEDYRDQLDAEGLIYLERIRGASQRMAGLIDDLLRLSRLTRSEMRIVQVDLSATAQSIADDLRATNPERQVEFSIMPGLMGNVDPNLLRIVLENLLGNAWKFTERHPTAHIEFAASQEGGQTVYRVRDDGAGFDMAYVEKLFGVFQRLHSIGEFEGTGIGLTIVQRIIHRHGGHVWVEAAVEQGATFYFTLGDSG
jgi:signal transduction histidine kinase